MRKFVSLFLAGCLSIAVLSAQKVNKLTRQEKKEGWKLLFDGKTTAGWHTFNNDRVCKGWYVENGELTFSLPEDESERGDIVTDAEYENFDLRLEWKISKGGNSGIFFSVKEGKQYGYSSSTGVEMQVLDNIDGADRHDPKHLAGALYDLISASETSNPKPVGEWNSVRILKKDGHITFWLNDVITADIQMYGDEWNDLVNNSKFRGSDFGRFSKGKIALQDHFDHVSYRNIKIKEL